MAAATPPATTLWDLLERRARATPGRRVLVDETGRSLTFAALRDRAERSAAALAARGIGPGSIVAWQLPTRIDTVVTTMALSRLGAVQAPILHLYREREVRHVLHSLSPAAFLVADDPGGFDYPTMARELARAHAPQTAVHVVDPAWQDGAAGSLPPPPADGDQVRWVYHTSGTTSAPKGVLHTDRTLLAGGEALAEATGYGPDDIGSIAFPFAHIAGPDYLVMMLVVGCSSVLVERFVPDAACALFRAEGVTFAGGSTAFYAAFLSEQRRSPGSRLIPSLRVLAGGGAPMGPELYAAVKQELGVPVLHGYGMTEAPMVTMGRPADSDEQRATTEGAPVAGAELKIVGLDGAPLPAGVDGEVCVRGPMVCVAYRDPALTEAAFDRDGFLRTGDLGHLRPDGHLVITGRLKDLIIRKGENISAQEVEEVLVTHARIAGAAVIGLPDPERGELVCAVVELAPGSEPVAFDEMVRHCRAAGLMTQKIPERLETVDHLPRSETLHKVRKATLKERFAP